MTGRALKCLNTGPLSALPFEGVILVVVECIVWEATEPSLETSRAATTTTTTELPRFMRRMDEEGSLGLD